MLVKKFSLYCEVELLNPEKISIGMDKVTIYKCLEDNELAQYKFTNCSFRVTDSNKLIFVTQCKEPIIIKNKKIFAEFTINSLWKDITILCTNIKQYVLE